MRNFFDAGTGVSIAALVLAVLMNIGCSPLEPGIWTITGLDSINGSYVGTLELRVSRSGDLEAVRVVRLLDRTHKDGRAIELAWTGTVQPKSINKSILQFMLLRADFIPYVDSASRTEADRTPLGVVGVVTESGDRTVDIWYGTYEDTGWTIQEKGVYAGLPGEEPIFRTDRTVQATHREPIPPIKTLLFGFFDSYHALPEVRPYVDHPAFRKAIHYQVVERTDFEYYRAHPDVIRVANKVADDIGLAETEIRANAFRATFHEKAAYYQGEVSSRFLGPHGMVENRDAHGEPEPDGDGALWSGVYGYTQALRYRATADPRAHDDLRAVVRGIHTLIDITGDPMNFARTVRLARGSVEGEWVRGQGPYAHLDWLRGGNNDMAQGLMIGMIAGWDSLPEGDSLRAEIATHAGKLLGLCEFMEERAPECPPRDGLDLPSVNPGMASIFAGLTNNDSGLVRRGLEWLRNPLLTLYARTGGGPFFVYGISDWSGNHLSLVSTLCIQWLLDRTEDSALRDLWRKASAVAWERLRTLEHPVHATLAAGLGVLTDRGEQQEATAQSLWGLRSFPFPKHSYPVDHTIRADFVLSPFPSLPWKFDWETNPGRMQSLTGHGLVESVVDHYFWNGSVFSCRDGAVGPGQAPGVDYLFLYWLARAHNLIGPSD